MGPDLDEFGAHGLYDKICHFIVAHLKNNWLIDLEEIKKVLEK